MTPKFQADADLNHKIVLGLRRRERILVSHDRRTMPGHFFRFVKTRSSPGIIIVSQNLDISTAIEDLIVIWAASDADEWKNQLGFVPF